MIKHPYHLVDYSPWPFVGACGALRLVGGLAAWIHGFDTILIKFGLIILLVTIIQWWRDVIREATYQGKHTTKVEKGIRLGIVLFILSEVIFFFAFFWAYFHSSLSPTLELGSTWPPKGVIPINPFDVPLLNTTVLLRRGATITWAHITLMEGKALQTQLAITMTVLLGLYFTLLQAIEYVLAPFAIADSVYGSTFYVATGFHGLHVIIGTSFILVITIRQIKYHFSSRHHFGFEARAWYWHFVDVVWLFLFICIYWWGY